MAQSDITVIGGGVVGLSVALGLLRSGHAVTVLDGADSDFRASQGNFGLVWLQGKGADFAPYARWTARAVTAWPEFSQSLHQTSGIDVALSQSGGYEFFTDVEEFADFTASLGRQQVHLRDQTHNTLSGDDLRRKMPGIGPSVIGASFCASDGHVNPLRLLRALRIAVTTLGGKILADAQVTSIAPATGGGFDLTFQNGARCGAGKLVLCAGLGAAPLVASLGFAACIRPQRGELLITEKLGDRLPFLSSTIRQVDEGGVQIGGTHADAGLNDTESLNVMAGLARHAVAVFPALASVRVVRSWGALRVMSPDGYPVYARSPLHPDAYLVTCHSGVTLAPLHASVLPTWLLDTAAAPEKGAFDDNRFAFSPAA